MHLKALKNKSEAGFRKRIYTEKKPHLYRYGHFRLKGIHMHLKALKNKSEAGFKRMHIYLRESLISTDTDIKQAQGNTYAS